MKYKNFLIALLLISSTSIAEVAIIVHPSNNDVLDDDLIARIFLGKDKSFPGGIQAIPITQTGDSETVFNEKIVNRSASQLKAYWSKLVFTGKGTPPKEVNSDAEVIELVATNPSAVGYVDANSVTPSVKIVKKL